MYGLYADKETQVVIKGGIKAYIMLEYAENKGKYNRIDAEIYRAIKKVEELNKERCQLKVNVSALESRLKTLKV